MKEKEKQNWIDWFKTKGFGVGTRSVLFGAHCWFIHPWFVALAWWRLYGFPRDPRLWVAFFVHDLGYLFLPNMDGPEGENHVYFGAHVMNRLFDPKFPTWDHAQTLIGRICNRIWGKETQSDSWHNFCFYHSRFMCKRYGGRRHSKLCVADKLSITLEPWWLYLPRVCLSGEIHEYISLAQNRTDAGEPTIGKYASMNVHSLNKRQWFERVCAYLVKWVDEHKDLKEDTWTPSPGENK